jgi:hypothetical protein
MLHGGLRAEDLAMDGALRWEGHADGVDRACERVGRNADLRRAWRSHTTGRDPDDDASEEGATAGGG